MANENGKPQQAAAVPFRRKNGKLQVCLIHKPGNGAWGIPKGFIDPGDTKRGTALKESHEEAGIRGRIVGERIGTYEYTKWGNTYTVAVFLMEVTDQDKDWDEDHYRERHWLKPAEARKLAKGRPFEKVLRKALALLEDSGGSA